MELIRKNINMNHVCGKAGLKITLDDDFIVPDSKPDIYKKIIDEGEVVIESLKAGDGKAGITGKLKFSLLYQTDRGSTPLECMEGSIDFNDSVNVPGMSAGDMAKCTPALDDLTISIINGRKISVSAIVSLEVYGENTYISPAAVDIENNDVCFLKKNIGLLALVENKRDILRIREQYELSSNKPNIGNIVWSAPELRNVETKAVTDELQVRGDIHLFAMYYAEDSNDNVQYIEESLPFVGKVPLPGANEGMIANVAITPSQKCVSAKPDYDGEPRIMEAELVLDLDIKLYEEQTLNLITDVYSVKNNIKPMQNTAQYDELLIRNHTRCRAGDKVKLGERKDKILQIISSTAGISIDEMTVAEDGLMVEGAAKVNILYISDNDNERIGCITKELPFSQKIDASGIREDSFYTVSAAVEQLNTAMLGSDELEIKFIAGLDALILNPMDTQVITELEEEPLDYNVIRKLPGISGYIVKAGDSLWNIAKKHYTTVERIMELNNLPSENIKPGMKLLITRSMS